MSTVLTDSSNYDQLEQLLRLMPGRGWPGSRGGGVGSGADTTRTLDQLFTDDLLQLNAVLAAGLTPR